MPCETSMKGVSLRALSHELAFKYHSLLVYHINIDKEALDDIYADNNVNEEDF